MTEGSPERYGSLRDRSSNACEPITSKSVCGPSVFELSALMRQ